MIGALKINKGSDLAIGIDRAIHKRLVDGLVALSEGKEGSSSWREVLHELQQAYERANSMLSKAEQSAVLYNEIQSVIRVKVATEFRHRKRKTKPQ